MKTDAIRFYRAVPMPLWLYYVLLYVGGIGIGILLLWLASIWFQWSYDVFFWWSVISECISWLVFVGLLSVAYVDVDLSEGKVISKNIIKHIGVKVEIPVQDIQEIRLTKKRYGDNVVITTSEKAYHLSVGDCKQFAKILLQEKPDIRLSVDA